MKQYIDKDRVVAEIDDWRHGIKKGFFSIPLSGREKADAAFEYELLGKIKDFLDTLEVKESVAEQEGICNGMFNRIIGDTWSLVIPLDKAWLKHGDKVKILITKEK